MPARYRADLVDVAWAKEHAYGEMPRADNQTSALTTAGGTSVAGHLRGQWGLVTGGLDMPTPSFDWQPFYGIGVMNRNMLFPIQGRQRLEGAVSQSLLCHDSSRLWLEQLLGLAFNGKNAHIAYYASVGTYTTSAAATTVCAATTFTTSGSPAHDFSAYKPTYASPQVVPPSYILIVSDTVGTGDDNKTDRTQDTWAYIGTASGSENTIIRVFKDEKLSQPGWNGIRPPSGSAHQFSIHGIALNHSTLSHGSPSGLNSAAVRSITRDGVNEKHIIVRPTLVQPSFTLGARFRADDGSTFITNYSGCKVSRCTFNFEEGNPVNFGSNFIARDFSHNIGEHDGTGNGVETMQYRAEGAAAVSATNGRASTTVPPNYMKNIRVTEQPYFYSSVQLTFQGEPIARFRRFTITVDNALDPRYYVTQNDASTTRDNRQILHEVLEGRRNISFGGSLDLDDDGYDAYPASASPTDAQFLRYLLNQSMTSSDIRDQNTLKGLGIQVELRKVNDFGTAASAHDKIKFHLPSNQAATTFYGSESEVGMVLRTAPLNIPAPPSVHIPMDIDGMVSSMHIEIMDGVAAGD